MKHVAFFTICAKLTLAFTITLLFPDMVVVLDLNKNIEGVTDLAKKGTDRQQLADFHTPIHPLLGSYKRQVSGNKSLWLSFIDTWVNLNNPVYSSALNNGWFKSSYYL